MQAILSLSSPQKRLWLEWKNNPDSLAYNINFCYRLKGDIDIKKLLESIDIVLCNKGTTRLQFIEKEGVPYQILHEKPVLSIKSEYVDKSNYSCDKNDILGEIKKYSKPFDLFNENPYRQLLIKVAEDEYILCMTFHHIALDGISGNMIIDAISNQYSSILNYKKLPKLEKQDIINWSKKDNIEESYKKELEEYWTKKLVNVETSTKLLERNRKIRKFRARRNFFALDERLSNDLLNLTKRTLCTPFIMMSALFTVLLYRYTQKKKIALAYTVSNRQKTEQDMIGFHIDMLPLVCDVHDDMKFRDLIDQIKYTRKAEKNCQLFSTPTITKILRSNKQELPNIVINQSLSFVTNFKFPGVECSNFHINEIDPQCDLLLSFDIKDGIFEFEFEFNLEKYEEGFISNLADSFVALINDITGKENSNINSYNILSDLQRKKLVNISAGEKIELQECSNVYSLIYDNIKSKPNEIALISGNQQITYKELDKRVDNYVNLINSHKNKSNLVGVCLERSTEQIIAILAVVKSGRAYLPLDPDYPDERLNYILKHSKSEILILNSENMNSAPSSLLGSASQAGDAY